MECIFQGLESLYRPNPIRTWLFLLKIQERTQLEECSNPSPNRCNFKPFSHKIFRGRQENIVERKNCGHGTLVRVRNLITLPSVSLPSGPLLADLGDLSRFAGGLVGLNSSAMIDGGDFDGAKAYKDSKVCNMLTMQEFHRRFQEETRVTFSSLYPGCIASMGLFREHISLFCFLFPPFQKYITKGYVSETKSGKRVALVVSDPSLTKVILSFVILH
ncbi:hypothetical protein AALP_AA7G110200 [Arabis alpina]|uniref:Protochlorophyllide reductase n=1 Tax=Arabis alpina TaxID=50452 RepID=A0A087GHB1_ARAAL|nr:hypothetical protein AALP_AA7G110200 [Arabis alpina]